MLLVVKFLALLTPFMPKLALGFPVYPVELAILGIIAHQRTLLLSNYSRFLLLSLFYSLISLLVFSLSTSYFPAVELFLLLKYALPVFLYSYLVRCRISIGPLEIKLVALLLLANLAIVVINYLATGISISVAMWGYSHLTRVVGLTGLELGLSGLGILGNNSVAFGVFIAFIVILFIEHFDSRKPMNVLMLVALLGSLFFTYSRSGIVVLVAYLMLKTVAAIGKMRMSMWLTYFFLLLIPLLYTLRDYLGVLAKLSNYSNFSDASSNIRLRYWIDSIDIWTSSGWNFFFGAGFSESAQYYSFGFANSESLFFTSLVQGGLVGTSILVFLFTSFFTTNIGQLDSKRAKSAVAINYFIPCWMLANLVGGDLLHTDFMIYPIILVFASIQNGNYINLKRG